MTRSPLARRSATILSGAVVAGLALAGCTASTPDADKAIDWSLTETTAAPSGDIDSFSWVSYAEPYSLDYAYAFDYADNQVLANVCESLLRLNPDYSLSPGLAESFAHPTPTTWVYSIRDGVTFHDGTPAHRRRRGRLDEPAHRSRRRIVLVLRLPERRRRSRRPATVRSR